MSDPAYLDPSLPVAERAADLVVRMTLEEKVSQMLYDAPAIERLGVPAYNWWNEALHGVARAGTATVFPQSIGLAATWDVELMREVADAIGDEARAKHHEAVRRGRGDEQYRGLTFWSPNVNIFRDPRWGRGHETYGEDPYLTARMGVAFVRGMQGDHPRYLKTVATPKHYAVHSGPEPARHYFDARVSDRILWDTYLPAFEACVREAGAASVMGAYNRVNGEPACASPTLLHAILREAWGFDGYVVSDCGAVRDIHAHHRVAGTAAEAAALAVRAGCDLNCGEAYHALLDALHQGLLAEEEIDAALVRLFGARFRLGLFDPVEDVPYAHIPYATNASAEHRALALRAARESVVLLKNEGDLLPLDKEVGSIAVVGPNAADVWSLLGNYHGTPLEAVTVLEGIYRQSSPATRITYAKGAPFAEGFPALQPISSDHLRHVEGEKERAGLWVEEYASAAFEGGLLRTRVDLGVDLVGRLYAAAAEEVEGVRWTGQLTAPTSGSYLLGVSGYCAYDLYFEGRHLAHNRATDYPTREVATVELQAGQRYDLRLEAYSVGVAPQVQLVWKVPGADLEGEAVRAAEDAEVVVAVLGLTPLLEGEEMQVDAEGFAGGDRTRIELPPPQERLLRRLHDLGKPLVLVLLNGGALALPWAKEHVPAIVEAWYPGEAGGMALADVLFGDYNPAGRLPVTFYASTDDLPPFQDYSMEGHTYRYFEREPLFPFGHGLSYTDFAYEGLCLPEKLLPGEGLEVEVTVRNAGERAGDEVVQVYVRDLKTSVPAPSRQLVGFRRVHLEPGEARQVSFTVDPHQLALVDGSGRRVVEAGDFELFVGGGGPGGRAAGLKAHFRIVEGE
jgi:beta-glucosidase